MNVALIWFFVGMGFFVCELLFPTMVVLFFGFGAWAAALASLAGSSLALDFAVFTVVSLASLVLLRTRIKSIFQGRAERSTGMETHAMAGRQGTVTKAMKPGFEGEISAGGSYWRAVAATALNVGDVVRVLDASPDNALLLRVEPIHAATENTKDA